VVRKVQIKDFKEYLIFLTALHFLKLAALIKRRKGNKKKSGISQWGDKKRGFRRGKERGSRILLSPFSLSYPGNDFFSPNKSSHFYR
jgi:hypothetical protein